MADFSDPRGDYNPYAAPASAEEPAGSARADQDEIVLPAERSSRLWARILDAVMLFLTAVPAGIAFAVANESRAPSSVRLRYYDPDNVAGFALCVLPLALQAYQWFLSARGQTLGKRWLGIRVVRVDGSPMGFVHGVLLREWVLSAAAFLPVIGKVVGLADVLLIFGAHRRCMHDILAGTRVVLALRNR